MQNIVNHFKIGWYGLLALLIITLVVLSIVNSKSLSVVSIKLKDGQVEHMDRSIPFVTKKGEELPDYRVSYLLDEQWHTVGTALNKSAKDWISFPISDPPNLTLVQGIRVTDMDVAQHDNLEEVQLLDVAPQGSMFEYEIETTKSFKSGMWWFAATPLGVAIFGAIGVAVFLVVLSHIGAAL